MKAKQISDARNKQRFGGRSLVVYVDCSKELNYVLCVKQKQGFFPVRGTKTIDIGPYARTLN